MTETTTTETKISEIDGPAAEALAEQLLAADRLQPGEEGLWKVWGARPHHIRPGDVVVLLDGEALILNEVADVIDESMRVRYGTPSGARYTLGGLFTQMKLFRPGTKNTLAR